MKSTRATSERANDALGSPVSLTATPSPAPPAIPDHELLKSIGRGSYGDVWLARNVLGQFRAVKIVYRATFEDERPFEREFEGIRRFEPISRSHPSQLNILHVGRSEGCFYYVMELADEANSESGKGGKGAGKNFPFSPSLPFSPASYSPKTLRRLLSPARFPPGSPARRSRLPPSECVEIGLALATALAHLHAHGLVHRDIKPSNIIFVGGVPKLADIGLVTDVDASRSFVGTEGFLPPEGPGTPQADLYSLGKVLYEMSTGRDRKDYPALPQDWDALDPAEQSHLLELNEVLVKVCEADPRRRYQSAEQLQADLAWLRDGQSIKRRRARERRWTVAQRLGLAAAAVAGAAALGWLVAARILGRPFASSSVPALAEHNSIAVLPVVNPGGDAPHEYLCSALTEEVANALTNCAGLRVIPRSSVMAFKGRTNEFAQAGRQLGVRTVLATTFLRRSNSNELTARLVNADGSAESWSATMVRPKEEFGALGADLARQVAQSLTAPLPESVVHVVETNLQQKLQAYQFLSAGLQRQSFDGWTKSNFTETVNLLQQALALDSGCTPAHLALGQAYKRFSGWHLAPREAMPTSRSHLLRVLELEPMSARARSMLGVIRLHFDYDWRGAETDLRAAVKLEPSPQNYSGLLCYLWAKGEWEEGNSVAEENRRRLPNAEWTASELAGTYYYQRRYDQVAEQASWLSSHYTNRTWGHLWMCRVHIGRGEFSEALSAIERVKALDPSPPDLATEGYIYGRMSRPDDAREILRELDQLSRQRFVSKLCWALVHAGLDERREAIKFIEQAIDERPDAIMHLKVDPTWENLRGEPEFNSLLRRIGLE